MSATTDTSASALASQPVARSDLAWRFVAPWIRFLLPAISGLALDLWLKAYAFPMGVPTVIPGLHPTQIPAGRHPALLYPPEPLIPHVLGFTTTINKGMVFGIAQGFVWLFLVFSIAATVLILWVFATSKRTQWVVQLALGLILAGALGNMYDRAVYSGVRDMLKFTVEWYPYIFNMADVLLCIGVPTLMLCWLLPPKSDVAK